MTHAPERDPPSWAPGVMQAFVGRTHALLRFTETLTAAHTAGQVAAATEATVRALLGAAGAEVTEVDAPDADPLPHFVGDGPDPRRPELGALADLPLVIEGDTIARLTVVWSHPRTFTDDDRALLRTIAAYTAIALHRTTLVTQQLATAMAVQQALLPQTLPTEGPVRFACRYRPREVAAGVGGDWYDAFTLPNGHLAMVIGDVAGHGIPASTVMAKLRYAARAHAMTGCSPGRILSHTNTLLWHTRRGTLASMLYLDYDPARRHARIASAGHLPALVVTRRGSVSAVAPAGLMLGVRGEVDYRVAHRTIAPGAAIVLYTDGLVETRDGDIDGAVAGLGAAAARRWAHGADVAELAEALLGPRIVSAGQLDDICLLVATHA